MNCIMSVNELKVEISLKIFYWDCNFRIGHSLHFAEGVDANYDFFTAINQVLVNSKGMNKIKASSASSNKNWIQSWIHGFVHAVVERTSNPLVRELQRHINNTTLLSLLKNSINLNGFFSGMIHHGQCLLVLTFQSAAGWFFCQHR